MKEKDDFRTPIILQFNRNLFFDEELKWQSRLVDNDPFTNYLYGNLFYMLMIKYPYEINNPLLKIFILSKNTLVLKYMTLTILCRINLEQKPLTILGKSQIQNLNVLLKNVKY